MNAMKSCSFGELISMRALGGKRKTCISFTYPTLRGEMSAVNRGTTHTYRGKSQPRGKDPEWRLKGVFDSFKTLNIPLDFVSVF